MNRTIPETVGTCGTGNVLGHENVHHQFQRAVERGRLASTFLFVGPAGIGKCAFARELGKTLLCEHPAENFRPCDECAACVQCDAGSHPDLLYYCKPEDRTEFPVRLLIGEKEQRMREGLCADIGKKPFMGGRRVAILDDADTLNEESSNCLLKTLEEPPPRSVLILIGTSVSRQLPTIRSRCQIVRFSPLSTELVEQILCESPRVAALCEKNEVTLPTDKTELHQLAIDAKGSIQRAIMLTDPALREFHRLLPTMLAARPFESVRIAATILAFVEEGTKEAGVKRARIRFVLESAQEWFEQQLREVSETTEMNGTPNAVTRRESLLRRIDRTVLTGEQLQRNLHTTTLVEAWCDALN